MPLEYLHWMPQLVGPQQLSVAGWHTRTAAVVAGGVAVEGTSNCRPVTDSRRPVLAAASVHHCTWPKIRKEATTLCFQYHSTVQSCCYLECLPWWMTREWCLVGTRRQPKRSLVDPPTATTAWWEYLVPRQTFSCNTSDHSVGWQARGIKERREFRRK